MAVKNFITLDNLSTYDSLIKQVISEEDAKSIKSAALNGKKLELYTIENPSASDTPRFSITLPFVEREIQGTNGKALIFNESDGGGLKFEHQDGTWSFVGVNDGGENGITGQIYSVKKNANGKYEGTRINMTNNGFFYTKKDSSSYDSGDEIATIKDVQAISSADKTVYVVETVGGSEDSFSKKYAFYQGEQGSTQSPVEAEKLTEIQLAKDMFVSDGRVRIVTVAGEPYPEAVVGDYYVDLTLANSSSEHIYIPANSLVDVYTGSVGSEVTITVDNNNQIGATITTLDGAKINDGSITKAKLVSAVQDSLDLADSSLQESDIQEVATEDIEALFA